MQLRYAVLLSLAGHVAVLGGGWLGDGAQAPRPVSMLTVRLLAGSAAAPAATGRPQPTSRSEAQLAARRTSTPARSAPRSAAPTSPAVPAVAAMRRESIAAKPVAAAVAPSRQVQTAETTRTEVAGRASPAGLEPASAGGAEVAPSWPGYLANPKPEMPLASRQRGEVGKVVLKVRVGQDGRPQAVSVLHSSGFARLDDAARKTVAERWRFAPARRGDTPVDADVNVPIVFRLDD
ncbi:energy transducer TonB [Jeongeupia wiesaeckerbachi]|uniref:energy transducer TonB n=1 Tax=Jeongeupia wiesaeckerbachi TaxID=3051218 RepID=UPI003D8059AE